MISAITSVLVLSAGLAGAAIPCGWCVSGAGAAVGQDAAVAPQTLDTVTVRFHISRMTCGGCATTARLALNRLPGVYSATVTLEDSLGVVRYDPGRVTPVQITTHLTKLTGFGATVLQDGTAPRKPGGK